MRGPLTCLLALGLFSAAHAAPATALAALPSLFDNGRAFCVPGRRLNFACLDAPELLGLDASDQARLLDHAASAGFAAVSFEAPLFGPKGLILKPGSGAAPVPARVGALERTLDACVKHGLYAFPVLYPPDAVDGLIGTATARAVFFAGRHAWGWQRWALNRLAGLKLDGRPLTRAPGVGAWILYQGSWPGGAPLAEPATQTSGVTLVETRLLRDWTAATVRAARQAGFRQELGVDLWLNQDLSRDAGTPVESPDAAGADNSAPPLSPLASAKGGGAYPDLSSLDALPPVAGSQDASLDDSSLLPSAPGYAGPDAFDWGALTSFLADFPRATQLDFMECTLDSEDWFDVGGRLAEAARSAEVPVLWRQDWRQAPRYERARHLRAPAPLAGLDGPWPADDWQQGLWDVNPLDPVQAPFYLRSLRLTRARSGLRLFVGLNFPAALNLSWGRRLPFTQHLALPFTRSLTRGIPLGHLAPGSWFLLKLTAENPRYGTCLARTQWVRAP